MKTKQSVSQNQQDLKRVGECLYRSQSSNLYYAIIKRGEKQIKRSLKTYESHGTADNRVEQLKETGCNVATLCFICLDSLRKAAKINDLTKPLTRTYGV